jgi:glucokinase
MISWSTWLGVDLGGTNIKWECLTAAGESVASGQVATPTGGHIAVTDTIVDLIDAYRLEDDSLRGVGVAVPGHLGPSGDSIALLPNVPGDWLGFPIRSYVSERTGFAPVLLNDARAFAVAELGLGAGRGHDSGVFATIGTGVGGAIATGGAVVRSPRDSFGELGHTVAVPDGELCGCGSRGCVEAYAGGTFVISRAEKRGVPIVRGPEVHSALAREAERNLAAAAVLEEAYNAFAVGISNACALAGTGFVVVGGAVATALPGYVARCRSVLEARQDLLGRIEVRAGSLGNHAGALGAALAAREQSRQTDRELEAQR